MPDASQRVLYLHGFASSPGSRKARFFQEMLGGEGIAVETPSLDGGDFEHLTLSGQLELIHRTVNGARVTLIGSSMGGYLAALYAAAHPDAVERLVLLAPAFRLYQLWVAEMGPEGLAHWKQSGALPVFHYQEQREVLLGYQLIEDAARFDPFPDFQQPALLFHGRSDAVVPVAASEQFAAGHANARLNVLESGHELTDVLPAIWTAAKDFLLAPYSPLR